MLTFAFFPRMTATPPIPLPIAQTHAADAKVLLKDLNVLILALGDPAAFPGGVGECREHAFRRHRIVSFNDKCVVNCSWLFHGSILLNSEVHASVSSRQGLIVKRRL